MTPKRLYYVMLGAIALLIILSAAGTYLANKSLKAEGDKLLELKMEQAVLDKQSAALAQAKKDITEYEDLEVIAKSIVPQEKDQARTVLEIIKLAREAGISISSIDFPDSLLGEAAAKGKTSKSIDNNTTQLTPLDKPKGLFVMEISVTSDADQPVTYAKMLNFLRKLESNRRTAQLVDLSIQPSETNRNLVTFSLVINSYVRPQ
ncbi:MAG: hypothetical protein M3Q36_04475 [bacterium]|nr:hypothetical protein [bacterium]